MTVSTVLLPWKRWYAGYICRHCLVWCLLCLQVSGEFTTACKRANCLHNSPCQIENNFGVVTTKCLCPPGWVGRHCHAKFYVTMTSVSMTTVTLTTSTKDFYTVYDVGYREKTNAPIYEIDSGKANTDNARTFKETIHQSPENTEVQYPKYSIQYWSSNHSRLCNILPQTSDDTITISGLRGNTDYIFCAKTSHINQCNFTLVRHHTDASYCVSVRTNVDNVSDVLKLIVLILASAAGVSILLLIAILIYAKRKKYLCAGKPEKPVNTYRPSGIKRTSMYDPHVEYPLLSPSANQNMTIHQPRSPGKPEHHLVQKRMRGYAAFSARNEQTIALSTVIEYDMPEDDMELCDNNQDQQWNRYGDTAGTPAPCNRRLSEQEAV